MTKKAKIGLGAAAAPLQEIVSQTKRIYNAYLQAERKWMNRMFVPILSAEEDNAPRASRVIFNINPFNVE